MRWERNNTFFNIREKIMNNTYKSYYDISRVVIWQDAAGVNDNNAKRARLVMSFRDGNPRFTVYTGEMGPTGIISFPMDVYTFGGVIETIKDVITSEPGTKVSVESIGSVWENEKPTNKTRIVSTLHIGKTKEGVIYLSVIDENKPKIIFPLKVSKFHNFRDGDKELVPDSKSSERLAKGLAETFSRILAQVTVNYTNDEYTYGDRKPGAVRGFESLVGATSPTKAVNKAPKKEITEIDSEIADIMKDVDF